MTNEYVEVLSQVTTQTLMCSCIGECVLQQQVKALWETRLFYHDKVAPHTPVTCLALSGNSLCKASHPLDRSKTLSYVSGSI